MLPVLFERPGRHPGQLVGRSPYLQPVHAEAAPELVGRILPVEISACGPNSLAGVIRSTLRLPFTMLSRTPIGG